MKNNKKLEIIVIFLFLINTNLFSKDNAFNFNKINTFKSNFIKNNTTKFNLFDNNANIFSEIGDFENNFDLAAYFYKAKEKNELNFEVNQEVESTEANGKDTLIYVPQELFTYADNPRYTLTGDKPLLETKIKPLNAGILVAFYGSVFVVQHEMQQNTIWKRVGPFQIQEDIKYCLWVDKFGHFFGGYGTSYVLSEALQTAGVSWETSTIIGSVLGLTYMTYIEILDGYSLDFGFSPSDFYADLLGAGFFLAQHYFPILQNFSPKFEYVNPPWLGEENRKPHDSFIDNYSAQSFWWSINIRNLFGGVVKEYLPDWMQLSFGYAAYSMCGPGSDKWSCDPTKSEPVSEWVWGNRKFIIALDYDLVKLLPDGPPFWNWLKQGLNLFKLPAPAVQFGKTTKFYILYPFEFHLGNMRI
jgi:hypothetical protein